MNIWSVIRKEKNMRTTEKNKEMANALLKLIAENPELEVVPMVDTECIFDDSYSTWMARWGSADIDEYWCSNERVYFKSIDFDTLVEEFIDNNYEDYPTLSDEDEELQKLAEEKINAYDWIKAISVNIVHC